MAVMTEILTVFGGVGNTREYSRDAHTVSLPRKVLQRRKVPAQGQVVAEDQVTVLSATTDSSGSRLQETIRFSVSVVRPITGDTAHVADALAAFRDLVNSDEFTNVVNTQEFLK